MNVVTKSMGNIVKALDSALASSNLIKISETMDTFEKQFVNMEVQAQFVETAMHGSTALMTPEEDVNMLMQQVSLALVKVRTHPEAASETLSCSTRDCGIMV